MSGRGQQLVMGLREVCDENICGKRAPTFVGGMLIVAYEASTSGAK